MPERGFDTGFWTKPFVQNLSAQAKLLFAYLKTNVHCNQAGVYTITPSTIAFETGLPAADVPGLLKSLEPEVIWYPEDSIVWVKPFFEEQAKSSKFIASALSIVTRNRLPEDLPDDFQEYNSRLLAKITSDYPIGLTKRECVAIRDRFTCQYCHTLITLPADYEMDHIIPKTRGGKDNYLNLVASCRECNQKKLDKTPDEVGFVTPHPRTFHAAQAVFLLKNSPELKKGWLQLFPEREGEADSMLTNIEQHYSILTEDIPLSKANASSKSMSVKAMGEKGVVKGEKDLTTRKDIPRSRMKNGETLYEGDRSKVTPKGAGDSHHAEGDGAVISVWCSVKGLKMTPADASALVARLRTEFPDVDILEQSKIWAARKISEPLKPGSKPSQQIWNWMRKAREFSQERRQRERESREGRESGAHQPDIIEAARAEGWTESESDEPGKAD